MKDVLGLILIVAALPIGALYGWWGIVVMGIGAYVAFNNGSLLHFSRGIHRPIWTDWYEEQSLGTTSWGISVGTVACEERICKKCDVVQRRNWRRMD